MEKSKIIAALKTFSTPELRELGVFVASPFFNKNEELIRFYTYLKKYAPHFPPKKIEREYVFRQLYPKKKYDPKQLNYLLSDLGKLLVQFLGYQNYKSDQVLEQYHILTALVNRNLEKEYQQRFKKTIKLLEGNSLRNTQYYYHRYLLAEVEEQHFKKQKKRVFDPQLQEVSDYFDWYYLSKKLEHTVEMLDRQRLIANDYELRLVDELMPYLQKNDYTTHPPIALNQAIYLLLKNQDAPSFFHLKELLERDASYFSEAELQQFYLAAINFCVRQVRRGNTLFQAELLTLYEKGISSRILYEDDYLSPWAFKNAVKLGIVMKRMSWTTQFITDYYQALAPSFQKDAYHFNLAELAYARKDYPKAQTHLNEVAFSDIFYGLGTRVLLLKIYWETNEIESLLALIASFKIYLRRDKLLSTELQTSYLNFLKILSEMQKLTIEKRANLIATIQDMSPVISKTWLLEQLK